MIAAVFAADIQDPAEFLSRLIRAASLGQQADLPPASVPPKVRTWMEKYGESLEKTGPANLGPAPAWGFITERADSTDNLRHLYLHVFQAPADDVVYLPVTSDKVKACRAMTEACAPITFHGDGAGQIVIPLPKTRDPLDTVISVDIEK